MNAIKSEVVARIQANIDDLATKVEAVKVENITEVTKNAEHLARVFTGEKAPDIRIQSYRNAPAKLKALADTLEQVSLIAPAEDGSIVISDDVYNCFVKKQDYKPEVQTVHQLV